jgi:hypothetical protein
MTTSPLDRSILRDQVDINLKQSEFNKQVLAILRDVNARLAALEQIEWVKGFPTRTTPEKKS